MRLESNDTPVPNVITFARAGYYAGFAFVALGTTAANSRHQFRVFRPRPASDGVFTLAAEFSYNPSWAVTILTDEVTRAIGWVLSQGEIPYIWDGKQLRSVRLSLDLGGELNGR